MSEVERLIPQARELPGRMMLQGKKALVVGGNKGLGQAMSLAFAAAGADVCVVGRGPYGFEETIAAIRQLGREGHSVACDVTQEANVVEMAQSANSVLGRVDILVNSQGTVHLEPSAEFDMDRWLQVMDVNLKSIVLTCKHVGRIMLEQGRGKIINMSSVRGFQGRIGDLAYSPSKGAVNQLTKSLAIEWGRKGINVNAIAPSFILTEISKPFFDDKEKSQWVMSRSPMDRVGELRDIFGPAVFLASDAANFVNGHVLLVDGGWTVA